MVMVYNGFHHLEKKLIFSIVASIEQPGEDQWLPHAPDN